jgi:hypothetical protein
MLHELIAYKFLDVSGNGWSLKEIFTKIDS